jgi:hypothetical protein
VTIESPFSKWIPGRRARARRLREAAGGGVFPPRDGHTSAGAHAPDADRGATRSSSSKIQDAEKRMFETPFLTTTNSELEQSKLSVNNPPDHVVEPAQLDFEWVLG